MKQTSFNNKKIFHKKEILLEKKLENNTFKITSNQKKFFSSFVVLEDY